MYLAIRTEIVAKKANDLKQMRKEINEIKALLETIPQIKQDVVTVKEDVQENYIIENILEMKNSIKVNPQYPNQ